MTVRCYEIPLPPFLKIREANEVLRASRARKHKKLKKIVARFPSLNQIYPSNRHTGGRYLSPEGRLYKDYIYTFIKESDDGDMLTAEYFEVSYIFFMTKEMLFTKDGDIRDVDVSNMLKAAEDALFDYLLESDSTVLSIHGYKRLAEKSRLVILLSPCQLQEPVFHQQSVYSIDHGKLL